MQRALHLHRSDFITLPVCERSANIRPAKEPAKEPAKWTDADLACMYV